ncbi:MAG TPA: peptidase, partial [Planctomycetaceae bacterium]|nr:peptidase [Planctomycetaceae bacterium]
MGDGSGSTGACGNTFGEAGVVPGKSDGGGTATGATGTGGPLPADRLANSARLTTVSAGIVPAG